MFPNGRLDEMKRGVAVLVNPKAGARTRGKPLHELLSLLRSYNYEVLLCQHLDALTHVVATRGPELRCIVAAGGDGTLAQVLNRAPGLPVALLPLGNENLVARHFQLPRCGRRLAQTIATGQVQHLDLARLGNRVFSLMAGVGLDAEVVHRVHNARRGHISQFNYALPTQRALFSYKYPLIHVEILETGERLDGAMVFVFNLPQYGLKLPIAPQARADDGLLDLCVCQRPGPVNVLRYLVAFLLRQQKRLPDFQHRLVRGVKLWSDAPVPLQTDGDPAGFLPASIEVLPGVMPLLVPRGKVEIGQNDLAALNGLRPHPYRIRLHG